MMAGGVQQFLLDAYPSGIPCFSLRKLKNTYTGSAIRVRRSTDNAEQNIGFNINGDLDTVALTTFCSGTNGFVTTWYDQSTSNNLIQTTAINQPQIVSAGNLITRNSRAYIESSSTQFFNLSSFITLSNRSIFLTYEKNTSGNQAILLRNSTNVAWLDFGLQQYISNTDFINISSINQINTLYLINMNVSFSSYGNFYRNGTLLGTKNSPMSLNGVLEFFPANQFRTTAVFMSEIILYNVDQSSNRTGIETNIKTYFGIP